MQCVDIYGGTYVDIWWIYPHNIRLLLNKKRQSNIAAGGMEGDGWHRDQKKQSYKHLLSDTFNINLGLHSRPTVYELA